MPTTKLNDAQEQKYMRNRGARCPCCGSTDLETLKTDADSDWLTRSILCHHCCAEWTDLYKLSGIVDNQVSFPDKPKGGS